MTDKEIKAFKDRLYRERNADKIRAYHQTEAFKKRHRERNRIYRQKVKERRMADPEFNKWYLEHERLRRSVYHSSDKIGRPFTMSERTRERIADLYARECKIPFIADKVNEPYGKVYSYIHNHIINKKTV